MARPSLRAFVRAFPDSGDRTCSAGCALLSWEGRGSRDAALTSLLALPGSLPSKTANLLS